MWQTLVFVQFKWRSTTCWPQIEQNPDLGFVFVRIGKQIQLSAGQPEIFITCQRS